MGSWLAGPKAIEEFGKSEVFSPQAWKDQAFAAAAKTLHMIAAKDPVVLFIEDAHWADSASLALLHYIARIIHDTEKVLVLVTFRSEELTSDAEGHPHPLTETLRMMRCEELFTEIKIENLSQDKISMIAEKMLGASLQPTLIGKLVAESKGNPLFVVESLRMLYEQKSLSIENNEWRLIGDRLGIPSKIKDIILRRLAILKYDQRRVLDAASVIGEGFDVELLSTVLGRDYLEVIETLNLIAHSTSIVYCEENCYRFDHARSRETLYEELSPLLKRGYHARIAEKLESGKDMMLPLSDLAYHFAQAGNKEKAVKYALAAGTEELARWSNVQAIKHFQYVLQNISEGHFEERRIATEALGDAYIANSMYTEAIKVFDKLATLETGTIRLRAIRKAMDAAYLRGDAPELLLEYARKAKDSGVDDRLEMARILNNRGKAWGWGKRGDKKQDLADYNAALQIFEEENSLADVAEALCRSGVVSAMFQDLEIEGIGKLLRSVAIFNELGYVRKEVEAIINAGEALNTSGLHEEGERMYSNALRIGEKIDVFSELAQASVFLAARYERYGKLENALYQTLKALDYWKKTDLNWMQGVLYAVLVRQYSKLGDLELADEYFNKLSKLSPDIASNIMAVILGGTFKMVYYAAKKQWAECDRSFGEYMDEIGRLNMPPMEALARTEYGLALEKQGRGDEAKVQLDIAQKIRKMRFENIEDRFGHANLQVGLMAPRKIQVGEEFEMRIDLVNVARKAAMLSKIMGVVLRDFNAHNLPSFCRLQNGSLEISDKSIGPFQVENIKLKLSAIRAGSYLLNPKVTYADDLGMTKAFKLNPITITVELARPAYEVLEGRVTTGTLELDRLLFGGIPEKYAVVMAASSGDERALLVNNFLRAGAEAGEITYYVTVEPGNTQALAEKHQLNFHIFVCNTQADFMIQDMPNVYKVKGVENLTDIDIALAKAFRTLNPAAKGMKRICLEIVSDALLQHRSVNTRRWLSALLPTLKSKGFTILAVIDPSMHPSEEAQAVLDLFDGEISIYDRETPKGTARFLKIKKMTGQKYLKYEILLTEK
jgi:KaiC/GvpD/RAD55 family RecA-like ATPase/tetratricopeptide (TPR) repeat protein